MNFENLRPVSELGLAIKERISFIESRGYDCLGWTVVDRSTFDGNTRDAQMKMGFDGKFHFVFRISRDGKYLYHSFNTLYSRLGPSYDQKSVIVFGKGGKSK